MALTLGFYYSYTYGNYEPDLWDTLTPIYEADDNNDEENAGSDSDSDGDSDGDGDRDGDGDTD